MSTVNTQQDSYVSTVIVPPCRAAAAGWAASPGLRAWLDPWWASNATALAEITAALAAGPSTPTPHTHFPLPPLLQLLIDRGEWGSNRVQLCVHMATPVADCSMCCRPAGGDPAGTAAGQGRCAARGNTTQRDTKAPRSLLNRLKSALWQ